MTLITTGAIALGGLAAYAFKRHRAKQKATGSEPNDHGEPLDAWPHLAASQSAKRLNAGMATAGALAVLVAAAVAFVRGGAIAWPL